MRCTFLLSLAVSVGCTQVEFADTGGSSVGPGASGAGGATGGESSTGGSGGTGSGVVGGSGPGGSGGIGGAAGGGGSGGGPACVLPAAPCGSMPCAVESFPVGTDAATALAVAGDTLVFTAQSNGNGLVMRIDAVGAWDVDDATSLAGANFGAQTPAFGVLDANHVLFGRGTQTAYSCDLTNDDCEELANATDGVGDATIWPLSDGTTRLVWIEKDKLKLSTSPVAVPFDSLPPSVNLQLQTEEMSFDGFEGEAGRLWVAGNGEFRRADFTAAGGSLSVVGNAGWVAATNRSCDPLVLPRLYAGTTIGALSQAQVVYSDVADLAGSLDPVEGVFGNWNPGPLVDASVSIGDADRDYVYLSVGGQLAVYAATDLDAAAAPLFVYPEGDTVTIRAIDASHEEYLYFAYDNGGLAHVARWQKTRLSPPL